MLTFDGLLNLTRAWHLTLKDIEELKTGEEINLVTCKYNFECIEELYPELSDTTGIILPIKFFSRFDNFFGKFFDSVAPKGFVVEVPCIGFDNWMFYDKDLGKEFALLPKFE